MSLNDLSDRQLQFVISDPLDSEICHIKEARFEYWLHNMEEDML
jgi:hypothetical protein